jgi:peroxiredoxin
VKDSGTTFSLLYSQANGFGRLNFHSLRRTMSDLIVGQPAPALKLTAIDGNEFDLQALKGQPVVLNFFKSTCPWCQTEMPRLGKVYAHLKEQGIEVPVQGIVVGSDTSESAQRFAQTSGLEIPLAIDAEKTARADFALTRVPTIVLIDAKGSVSRVYEGASEQLAGIVEQTVFAAARGDAPPNYEMVGNG